MDQVQPSGTPVQDGSAWDIYLEITGILVSLDNDIIQKYNISQDNPIRFIKMAAGNRGTRLSQHPINTKRLKYPCKIGLDLMISMDIPDGALTMEESWTLEMTKSAPQEKKPNILVVSFRANKKGTKPHTNTLILSGLRWYIGQNDRINEILPFGSMALICSAGSKVTSETINQIHTESVSPLLAWITMGWSSSLLILIQSS